MEIDAEPQKYIEDMGNFLPDISIQEKTSFSGRLSQVGMRKIEMPVLFHVESGAPVLLPAQIDAFVSLDNPDTKGIHMSRLYLELKNNLHLKPVTPQSLKEILQKFITTHTGLSESSYLVISFQVPVERKALVSGERGYRQYPVTLKAQIQNKKFDFELSTEILYSSTCPCSVALARQLIEKEFLAQHADVETLKKEDVASWLVSEASIIAFPHAQRSLARVSVRLQDTVTSLSLVELINISERALGTPVQAAVKRADEQEFARLNANNLMFCEDAARKLRGAFESDLRIVDYSIYVEHQESLHPHDAVSKVVKGIDGGFRI